jgi:hypothetical protein
MKLRYRTVGPFRPGGYSRLTAYLPILHEHLRLLNSSVLYILSLKICCVLQIELLTTTLAGHQH